MILITIKAIETASTQPYSKPLVHGTVAVSSILDTSYSNVLISVVNYRSLPSSHVALQATLAKGTKAVLITKVEA
jgi:2-keto-3-deoxy-L-rhamnonate aldolase RhmA